MAVRLVSVKPMSTAVVRTDPSSASAQSAAKVPGSGGRPAAEETATRTVPENSSSSSRSVRTAVATSTGSGKETGQRRRERRRTARWPAGRARHLAAVSVRRGARRISRGGPRWAQLTGGPHLAAVDRSRGPGGPPGRDTGSGSAHRGTAPGRGGPVAGARRASRPGHGQRLDTRRGRHLAAVSAGRPTDRKSTRLNSSHANISYAVFCLKKKKKQN